MAIQVRKCQYRGKDGWSIVGRKAKGHPLLSIFTTWKEGAEMIREAIKKGGDYDAVIGYVFDNQPK